MDNDYYLYYNYKNEKVWVGSIFKDYWNMNEFLDKNMIIYGYNMKDGFMFVDLCKYLDKDFLVVYLMFFYELGLVNYEVEIFVVYEMMIDFYYIEIEFLEIIDFEDYL